MYYEYEDFINLTDAELIRLVQEKDEAAFSELISRYRPRIWRLILANTRQHRDAEEILMDTWMAVWDNIDKLQKVDSFLPWLRSIAYNACSRYYASAKHISNEIPIPDSTIVEQIDTDAFPRFKVDELRESAREAVQNLPMRIRAIAILFYLEAWSMNEISNELNLPIATIKTKLREIRTMLRKEFDMEIKREDTIQKDSVLSQNTNIGEIPEYKRIIPARTRFHTETEPELWSIPNDALLRFGRGYIHCMALSPDSDLLVFGTPIGLWWYDVSTLQPITLWETDCQKITAVDISSSGEWIATGHADGSIRIWDIQKAKCIKQLQRKMHFLQQEVHQLAFSPDSMYLAANGFSDYVVDVWNAETGVQLARFGDPEVRFRICMKRQPLTFSPDNRLLACLSPPDDVKRITEGFGTVAPDRDRISIWDIGSRKRIAHLGDCTDFVYGLTFSPDGKILVATVEGSEETTLNLWDTHTWELQRTEKGYGKKQLLPAFSSEGTLRVVPFSYEDAAIWDVSSYQKLVAYNTSEGNEILHCFFNGSQLTLATSKDIDVWSIEEDVPHKKCYNSHHEQPISLVFSSDEKTLVAEYPFPEGTFLSWDFDNPSQNPNVSNIPGERHRVYKSNSGKIHTTSVEGNLIKIREFGNEKPMATCPIVEKPRYRAVAYSDNANLLAYGDTDKNIYVWDIGQEEILHKLIGKESSFSHLLDFCPNGNYLASDSEQSHYQLWDIQTGKEIPKFQEQEIEHIAFSPCGNLIAGEVEKAFLIWDLNSNKVKRTLSKPSDYRFWWQGGIAFTPDSQYLATGLEQRAGMGTTPIMLWNVLTGEQIATLSGHPAYITALTFSNDGKLLASGSGDGTILLWDVSQYL